ncbi:DinB family protein [Mangrovibacillus cuniculi]|uniref:DinB family protein n=1 Tax=Mangrovibacillus cuniculi TaxID=2593652 RepID=A0A7S8HG01_9BACI|nr:DinB family protein [Mangrovibacillus cuniculi]QPC46970.1 DinB family protein [Mangrovibacillus cuniculi]
MNLLHKYQDNAEKFSVFKKFSNSNLTTPIAKDKWSPIQIIGHILYWDIFTLEKMIPLMKNGATLPAFPDHGQHNHEAMKYIERFVDVDEIINEFVSTRNLLVNEFENLDRSITFIIENEPGPYTLERYIKIFLDHDIYHLNQIMESIGQK